MTESTKDAPIVVLMFPTASPKQCLAIIEVLPTPKIDHFCENDVSNGYDEFSMCGKFEKIYYLKLT